MRRCPHCQAFVPKTLCPECGEKLSPTVLSRLRNVTLGGAAAITLAACYGAPYPEPQEPTQSMCEDTSQDLDGDGHCGEHDGDENDPDVQ